MPRRRQLKSIASGLSGRFVSRNNDIDGYWAVGVLYGISTNGIMRQNKDFTYRLDILSGKSNPECRYSERISKWYRVFLSEQLAKLGFENENLVFAYIQLDFNVAPTAEQIMGKNTWGEPFRCSVKLTDDLGKEHVSIRRGWCAVHSPGRESRSTRRYVM